MKTNCKMQAPKAKYISPEVKEVTKTDKLVLPPEKYPAVKDKIITKTRYAYMSFLVNFPKNSSTSIANPTTKKIVVTPPHVPAIKEAKIPARRL